MMKNIETSKINVRLGRPHIAACVHMMLISEDAHNQCTKRTQDTRGSHDKHAYPQLIARVFSVLLIWESTDAGHWAMLEWTMRNVERLLKWCSVFQQPFFNREIFLQVRGVFVVLALSLLLQLCSAMEKTEVKVENDLLCDVLKLKLNDEEYSVQLWTLFSPVHLCF